VDSMPWKQELVHKITRVLTFQALEISSAETATGVRSNHISREKQNPSVFLLY
jgi:hypothetical protein